MEDLEKLISNIDWEAYMEELEAAKANEELWAKSDCSVRRIHQRNAEDLSWQIDCIKSKKYKDLLDTMKADGKDIEDILEPYLIK